MFKRSLAYLLVILGLASPSLIPRWTEPFQPVGNPGQPLTHLQLAADKDLSLVTGLPKPPLLRGAVVGGDIAEPKINAPIAVITDAETGVVLWSKDADRVWPLASITKLMTAAVLLDQPLDWQTEVTMEELSYVAGGRRHVFPGERVVLETLWNVSLVASDNFATMQLVRSSGLTDDRFVAAMNAKAREWGLLKTKFAEPTGLSLENTAPAREVSRLAHRAFALPKLRATASSGRYQFAVNGGQPRVVDNTNPLLASNGNSLLASKTGYLPEAGGAVVALAKPDNEHVVILTVMGEGQVGDRFSDLTALSDWVKREVTWPR